MKKHSSLSLGKLCAILLMSWTIFSLFPCETQAQGSLSKILRSIEMMPSSRAFFLYKALPNQSHLPEAVFGELWKGNMEFQKSIARLILEGHKIEEIQRALSLPDLTAEDIVNAIHNLPASNGGRHVLIVDSRSFSSMSNASLKNYSECFVELCMGEDVSLGLGCGPRLISISSGGDFTLSTSYGNITFNQTLFSTSELSCSVSVKSSDLPPSDFVYTIQSCRQKNYQGGQFCIDNTGALSFNFTNSNGKVTMSSRIASSREVTVFSK